MKVADPVQVDLDEVMEVINEEPVVVFLVWIVILTKSKAGKDNHDYGNDALKSNINVFLIYLIHI